MEIKNKLIFNRWTALLGLTFQQVKSGRSDIHKQNLFLPTPINFDSLSVFTASASEHNHNFSVHSPVELIWYVPSCIGLEIYENQLWLNEDQSLNSITEIRFRPLLVW